MKESKYSVDNRIVFRETFESENSVRANGGVPTNVLFSEGVGQFNGSSQIKYPKIISGTYSIRIRFKRVVIETKSIIDFSNHGLSGVGYLYINTGSGILSYSSGTPYVNGIQTNTCTITTKEIILSGLSIISVLTQFSIGARVSSANPINADYELVEIYKGTLTASEVANLYNSSFNMPAVPYSGQIIGTNILTNGSFDTTVSGWSIIRSTIVWQEGGFARVTKSNAGVSQTFGISKGTTLTVDKKYTVTFRAKSSTTTERPSYSSQWSGFTWIQQPYYTNDWQNYMFTATAASTSWVLYLSTSNVEDGVYVDIDDIIVQELKPTALMLFDATQGGLIDRSGLRTLTATDVVTRREGNSYSAIFNGSSSKIETNSDFIGTKAVTVCGWVKNTTFGESNNANLITNGKFYLMLYNANTNFQITSDNNNSTYSALYSVKKNQWQFISITRKSDGKVSLYIGGKNTAPAISGSADQNSGTPVAATAGTYVTIGNSTGQTRTMDGSIKMLNVYEGILTINEITALWQQTRRII